MSPVRRPRAAHVTLAAAGAALLPMLLTVLLTGCTADASSSPTQRPATRAADDGTPLSDVDTTSLVVRRAPFCDLVEPAAVTRALGAEAARASTHRSGQRTRISDGMTDVVHEFGCLWTAGGTRAEAWVFAPPITRQRARTLSALVRDRAGCTPIAGAAEYGDPTVATSCRGGGGIEVSYRGLFGDAWLTCALTTSGGRKQQLAQRAGRWCAAVAEGAAG